MRINETTKVTEKLYNLLRYIEKHEINDEFTKKLDDKVESVRKDNDWREKHMQYEMNIQDAMREGEAKGEARGYEKGSNRTARLSALLVQDGRYEDIVLMGNDESHIEKLFEEYGV